MPLSSAALTDADAWTLVRSRSADARAVVAHKLCRSMERQPLDAEERAAAQEILRVMAADAAELVRRALAVTLRSSALVPRDVALKLAADVESVSIPMLTSSPAFTDDDLVALVRGAPVSKQVAIAGRPTVSGRVVRALVSDGAEPAVAAACANDNATFEERDLLLAVDRFATSESVHRAVAHRKVLPISIAERLVVLAGEAVRHHLIEHHALRPETALLIAAGAKERATYDLVEQAARTADLPAFCAHLNESGRLTASLLLRGLASGHMSFVEHGLAELAGVPHGRTWIMVHDAGLLGLKAIYERAGLPSRLFPTFRAGVDAYRALMNEGGADDRERFQERMLQRFLTGGAAAGRADLDHLLDKMDRLTLEVRRSEPRRGAA